MAQLAALILVVFGLLPIANWIAGGHDAPWYRERLTLWSIGGAVVVRDCPRSRAGGAAAAHTVGSGRGRGWRCAGTAQLAVSTA